ncbi:MAG: type II toxin-antitoxin system HicB family antitoxin [Cetobacterium sp.]|uniref:type II toxin-antitoxin system HicB family antitoxin n=1 Tax=Cetobacterium sp. TaxID=2071632 RepID=UPI003EE6642E
MNELTYPVVLTYEDNLIYVGIPDLEIDYYTAYAETLDEAVKIAKELITLEIMDLEDEKKVIPLASKLDLIKEKLEDNQEIILINLWLPYEKSLVKVEYKKKTLSIPVWLDMLASQKNLNFSQILQKALKKELDII